MRYVIGFDLVDIDRFAEWDTYSASSLRRIFSEEEVNYCCSEKGRAAERFAVRFAVREALYKAISAWCMGSNVPPVLRIFRAVTVRVGPCGVVLHIDWPYLWNDFQRSEEIGAHCSVSHARAVAGASVLLFDVMQ